MEIFQTLCLFFWFINFTLLTEGHGKIDKKDTGLSFNSITCNHRKYRPGYSFYYNIKILLPTYYIIDIL